MRGVSGSFPGARDFPCGHRVLFFFHMVLVMLGLVSCFVFVYQGLEPSLAKPL